MLSCDDCDSRLTSFQNLHGLSFLQCCSSICSLRLVWSKVTMCKQPTASARAPILARLTDLGHIIAGRRAKTLTIAKDSGMVEFSTSTSVILMVCTWSRLWTAIATSRGPLEHRRCGATTKCGKFLMKAGTAPAGAKRVAVHPHQHFRHSLQSWCDVSEAAALFDLILFWRRQ